MTDLLVQLGIAITGVLAAWVNQDPRDQVRRWGCLFGLAGQPFWVWAAVDAHQWGVLAVTLCYTVAFLRGVWHFWWSPT